MDIAALVAFAGIYALAVATPGPGIGAIVARGLARGRQGVVPFIAGFVVGDLVWFVLAAFGLAVVAQTFATAFQILTYAGAVYLLYLAWRIWTSPVQAPGVDPAPEANDGLQAFLGSFALTMGNPKVAVFFLAIMPLVVDVATVSWLAFAELGAIIVIVISTVLGLYAALAIRARRLLRSERAIRIANRGTAGLMAGVAVAIAAR